MSKLAKHIVSFVSILLGLFIGLPASIYGATDKSLQNDIQVLQQSALELQADINKLERDVLFPPVLRTDLYLSVQVAEKQAENFSIEQVLIEIDGVEAVDYWYGVEQSNALLKGGKQLLWQGNVTLGKHRLKVAYQFVTKRGKPVSGEKTFMVSKAREQQPLLLSFSYEDNRPSVSLSPVRQ